MSTSAISGRIVFKQGPRAYLDANIRRNSLVFDTDNNILLYSPSGTNFYEFYPGQGGGVSGTVYWNDIIGEPTASNSTSGILTSSDWNLFNAKASTSAIPTSSNIQDLIYLYSHPEIVLLSGIANTTPSATLPSLKTFPVNFIPNIIGFEIVGPISGTYSVSGNIYGYDGISLVNISTFSINESFNVDGGIYFNIKKYSSFAADLVLLSGSISSGVYVKATT